MKHDRQGDPAQPVTCSRRRDRADAPVFALATLLRHEARCRCALPSGDAPPVCLLDPDGDLVRHLQETERARRSMPWACCHMGR